MSKRKGWVGCGLLAVVSACGGGGGGGGGDDTVSGVALAPGGSLSALSVLGVSPPALEPVAAADVFVQR
jgi:hypothetical protein